MKKTIVLLGMVVGCNSPEQDTCHPIGGLSCSQAPASCGQYFGESHSSQVVCEQVTPTGNCLPLDEFTADHTAACGDVSGDVWCCGQDSDASCLPFDDAVCDGATLADVTGQCESAFGEPYTTPRTCLPEDGPTQCKNLSRMSQGVHPTCNGESRDVWCCTLAQ